MSFQPIAPYACDSYKLGHHNMYPEGTTLIYSNFTPRADKHSPIPAKYADHKVVVFGLQFVLHELVDLWNETFFNKPFIESSLRSFVAPFVGDKGFDKGIHNFKALHKLGYLPIQVKALPEGSVVPLKTPVFTIKNTHPDFAWVVGYLEVYLSQQTWKMSTVATISRAYYKIISTYAKETGVPTQPGFSPIDFTRYQAHDFSARGLSGAYDDAMVGASHLTSFLGTDSLLGTQLIQEYYSDPEALVGASVPATEHSIMTSRLREGELSLFQDLLTEYDSGVISIVSDSYDFWKVMTDYVVQLKDLILARKPDSLGFSKVVFRPDSGNPVDIICGTATPVAAFSDILLTDKVDKTLHTQNVVLIRDGMYFNVTIKRNRDHNGLKVATAVHIPEPTPEMKGALVCLYEIFGGTTNELGYKHLSDRVGLIYGDSITMSRADEILSRLKAKGFASDSIILGVGSYSYQMITRDTFGYAMKSTYQVCNGVGTNIFKDPATDDGTKKSACGLLHVDENFKTTDQVSESEELKGALQTVLEDSTFYNQQSITEIRNKLNYYS